MQTKLITISNKYTLKWLNNWATLIKIGVMREQMNNESKNGWNRWNLGYL